MTIHELKELHQSKVDALIVECNVFFAFSNQQFEEGKKLNPVGEGEKYTRIPGGGFLPSAKSMDFKKGIEEIHNWYTEQLKQPELRRANIAYELANHEAYYTGEIDQTMDALDESHTEEEVWAVYKEECKKINWDNY